MFERTKTRRELVLSCDFDCIILPFISFFSLKTKSQLGILLSEQLCEIVFQSRVIHLAATSSVAWPQMLDHPIGSSRMNSKTCWFREVVTLQSIRKVFYRTRITLRIEKRERCDQPAHHNRTRQDGESKRVI